MAEKIELTKDERKVLEAVARLGGRTRFVRESRVAKAVEPHDAGGTRETLTRLRAAGLVLECIVRVPCSAPDDEFYSAFRLTERGRAEL